MKTEQTPALAQAAGVRPEHSASANGAMTAAELLLLGVIVTVALTVRAWNLGAIGINHFDEGVYVTSAYAVAHPGHELFPGQVQFSPPLYYTAVGLAARLFGGPIDRVAILLNVILGTLTVAALWLVARSWSGPRAAVIAATLLALNPTHILLSRVALTDIGFALWFLLALFTIERAVHRVDYRLALLAGVFTGLAWNTKYHGWFILVITGVALAPELWAGRRDGRWRTVAAVWLTAGLAAATLYLPWAIHLRDSSADAGGYGGIIRYFATMLRGAWLGNTARYAQQQLFIESALSRVAPLVAVAGALFLGRRWPGPARLGMLVLGLGAAALVAGQAGVTAVLALLAIPLLLRGIALYRSRVLVCWIGLWVVAAPFYQPYARLLLPLTIATLFLTGTVLERWLRAPVRRPGSVRAGLACLAAAGVVFVASRTLRADIGNPWRGTRDLSRAAAQIDRLVPADVPVYVLGEPALAWYLRSLGHSLPMDLRPAELDTIAAPAFIVSGVYVDRAPPLRNRMNRMSDRLTRVAEIEFDPNDLRLLDDMNPRAARRFRASRDTTFDLSVHRLERR